VVTVEDAEGHNLSQSFGYVAGVAPATCPSGRALSADGSSQGGVIDVSKLDDGDLTVTFYGTKNGVASPGASDPFNAAPTKKAGLDLNFDNSSLSTANTHPSFPVAAVSVVQSPSLVQLQFSQPVKLHFIDNESSSGPK